MVYRLGVDLGTTWTAAAIWRDGRASIAPLGTHQAAVPSVVCIRPGGGAALTGDGAQRKALSEPEHIAREFKRRLGDDTPLIVGGEPNTPEQLSGYLLRDVISQVVDQEGQRPSRLVLAHPANWGPHKLARLDVIVEAAGWDAAETWKLSEPVAAAISYAATNRIEPGRRVCVYDLGGGTFDVAILERTDSGFSIVGRPDGLEHVGGLDVDAAVFRHVQESIDLRFQDLDPSDQHVLIGLSRLRSECTRAKETLSDDLDTVIPVQLPGTQGSVRLTRVELEQKIRPALLDTVESTRRAIHSAGLEPGDIDRVLLVGGSSRIPLVAQLVQSELGLPATVDAHPKHAIALGAAIHELPVTAPADRNDADPGRADRIRVMPPPDPAATSALPTPAPPDPAATSALPAMPPAGPSPMEGEATVVAGGVPIPAPTPPANPPKAIRVPNPTNPPPGWGDNATVLAGSPGGPGQPQQPPPSPAVHHGANRPATGNPATGNPAADDRSAANPPAPGEADRTRVLDPAELSAATGLPADVIGGATSVLGVSSTTVLDPSMFGGGGGAAHSWGGGAPAPGPDSTTVSPRPSLPSSQRPELGERRNLLIGIVAALVVIGAVLLLVRPFERFGTDDDPVEATTTTAPTEDTTDPSVTAGGTVTVPDVIGQPADRATIRLLNLGFEVEEEIDDDAEEAAGTVIAQSVAGGEAAEAGATVVLTVSSGGEDLVVVPDIAGLAESEAAATFRETRFTDVERIEEPSQTVAVGEVIRTDPPAGSSVDRNAPITVFVSSGVEIGTVPDVAGLREAEAVAELEGAGFTVEVVTGDGEAGIVSSQDPTPGGQRVLPATVTITVGS